MITIKQRIATIEKKSNYYTTLQDHLDERRIARDEYTGRAPKSTRDYLAKRITLLEKESAYTYKFIFQKWDELKAILEAENIELTAEQKKSLWFVLKNA